MLLYEGENLIVLITNHLEECDRVEMTMGEQNYHARVWLNHQKPVRYSFLIEKEGRELLFSATREARAQYAIIEKWEPSFEESAPAEGLVSTDAPPTADVQPLPPPASNTTRVAIPLSVPLRNAASLAESSVGGVASLIEKWGL